MARAKHYGREIMDDDEFEATLTNGRNPRDRAIFLFYYIFGCRVSEGLKLKAGTNARVEDGRIIIHFQREKQRKSAVISKDILRIHINSKYAEELASWIKSRAEGEYLFRGRTEGHLTRFGVLKILKRMNPNIWVHFLRANKVTYFKTKGIELGKRIDWFGWADSRPDKSYAGRQPVELEENL